MALSPSLNTLLADGCAIDERHKLCRSRGGESCAFDGAAIVLMPVADAAHVIHGPIACAANAWEGRGVRSQAGELHLRGFTTDLSELDIIYGGEAFLAETVREAVRNARPAAVFVYATCVSGLIGEDIEAACKQLSEELALPVVPVNAPGFVGPKNLGNRIAGETLVRHVIGTAEPDVTTPTDIALIGDYNVGGDLEYVDPLLAECGIRVLSHITGGARYEELRYAHRARVAAVVCSRALINVAGSLARTWGIPGLEVSFFGSTEIARSLRAIASTLEAVSPEANGVTVSVERVIAGREAWLTQALAPYAGLRGKRAVLYSGGVKSWSLICALQDLGIEVIAVGTKKSSHEDEAKARAILGDGVPLLPDISPAAIRRLFAEEGADLLVAGGRNRYLAAKEGWPFVDVNQEREHAYAGYEGLVDLAHDLWESFRFYEAQDAAEEGDRKTSIAPAIARSVRPGAIDPLKNAPIIGAIMALQGVDRALPVLHSAQGCSFLGKVLLIRHFNEPISLATTKLFTEEVVLGSEEAAEKVVRSWAEKPAGQAPELIALVSGALAEVKGDDTDAVAAQLDAEIGSGAGGPTILALHAPDYAGGLEEGYALAVGALAGIATGTGGAPAAPAAASAALPAPAAAPAAAAPAAAPTAAPAAPAVASAVIPSRITVLAGAFLTPGDATWLRETCEDFGLDPVVLPDLAALDGSREEFGPLASGGTTLDAIRALGRSAHTLVIGASLEPVARTLAERFGTPFTTLGEVHGCAATDRLLGTLSSIADRPVPARHRRQRAALVDAMRDAHLELAGAHVTLALEPDHALSLSAAFEELAAAVTAIVPTVPVHASGIRAAAVVCGDFASVPAATHLLVSNSHGARTALALGAAHVETGFPVFATYGASRLVTLGYAGAMTLVDAAANALLARERMHHPAAPAPSRVATRPYGEAGSIERSHVPVSDHQQGGTS